jgi:hypothetical protein
MVVEEYQAEKGGIPNVHRIKDQLMMQVDRQNKADKAMMSEPLKSGLERLGIPSSTRLVASGAWKEGVLFLDAVRDMRVQGTDTDIHLRLRIISQLSAKEGSQPFIAQVSVIPDPPIELFAVGRSGPGGKLRYHYGYGPIPDIGKIEQDVQALFTTQQREISQASQKAQQVSPNQRPPGTIANKRYRPRH